MARFEHKELGIICEHQCHQDGVNIHEIMGCCRLCRVKYYSAVDGGMGILDSYEATGVFDPDRFRAALEERGMKPLWIKDERPMPKFMTFKMPKLKNNPPIIDWDFGHRVRGKRGVNDVCSVCR